MTRLYLSWLWLKFNVSHNRYRYEFEFSRSHEDKGWLLSVVDRDTDKFVKNLFHDRDLEANGLSVFEELFTHGMKLLEG